MKPDRVKQCGVRSSSDDWVAERGLEFASSNDIISRQVDPFPERDTLYLCSTITVIG